MNGVTFSTYEPAPGRGSSIRIVGIWPADGQGRPAGLHYRVAGKAFFNLESGRRSPAPVIHPYAAFTVDEFAQGRHRELGRFFDLCGACGVQTTQQLLDLHQLEYQSEYLDAVTATRLLSEPATAERFCTRPNATLDRLVGLVVAGVQGGSDAFAALVGSAPTMPNASRSCCGTS